MARSKVGVLIPGVSGVLGSALTAGLWITRNSRSPEAMLGLLTEIEPARRLALVSPTELTIGGWDLAPSEPASVCRSNRVFSNEFTLKYLSDVPSARTFPAILLPTDYACARSGQPATHDSWQAAVDQIRRDIDAFREAERVDYVVVINLSSPHKLPAAAVQPGSLDRAIECNSPSISSALLYCIAAIRSGCGYVDFTPTDTLVLPDVESEALTHGVPLAGRDGSTGQTLLKSVIAHMFEKRHLPIQGWYSTNILGNHDGLVLSDPEYSTTKIADKKEVLNLIAPDKPHLVDIRYYPPRGDCKEAWDCVDFSGWMGESMSVRINWIGRDSVLAAPLLIDLARLMAFCQHRGLSGIQAALGVFFKHPLGTPERRYFQLFEQFRLFCESFLEGEST